MGDPLENVLAPLCFALGRSGLLVEFSKPIYNKGFGTFENLLDPHCLSSLFRIHFFFLSCGGADGKDEIKITM